MAERQSATVNEAFKVDEKLEKEFEEALKYELKDDDIERAKLLVGVNVASRSREHFSKATPDAIRNWARGMGDDNPLYTEEDYGPTTRWGSQIGHGTMVGHIKTPMYGDPMPEDIKKATRKLFRGVHVFVSGGTWGLVSADLSGRSHLLLQWRRIPRGEKIRVCRKVSHPCSA